MKNKGLEFFTGAVSNLSDAWVENGDEAGKKHSVTVQGSIRIEILGQMEILGSNREKR